ncbi:MAG: hypothetical protein ACLQVX_17875 [Limisphaerales bacterium]
MAQETVIRDRTGKRLGIIVEEGNRLVARNLSNLPLGYYYPKDDYTRDTSQQIICKGNALSALVLKAAGL